VFPEMLNHVDMTRLERHFGKITSAGFVSFRVRVNVTMGGDYEILASTYGESESLKIKPDPADAGQLTLMFKGF
jgi:hypothetical protein